MLVNRDKMDTNVNTSRLHMRDECVASVGWHTQTVDEWRDVRKVRRRDAHTIKTTEGCAIGTTYTLSAGNELVRALHRRQVDAGNDSFR